jgi:ATP citrate (pro-S)-lyase
VKLVAKPDQLIKRRGKAGLLALNKSVSEAKGWIAERAGKPVTVSIKLSFRSKPLSPFYPRPSVVSQSAGSDWERWHRTAGLANL